MAGYTKMGKNRCSLSTVEFLPFPVSLPATKMTHQKDPVWKQTYPRAIGPSTCWGQAGTSPTGDLPAASSERVISETCLWGMCQIRFLCDFQTVNKWTSRAKRSLSLGSAFCTHTRACSQTTHTLEGSAGHTLPVSASAWPCPACSLVWT